MKRAVLPIALILALISTIVASNSKRLTVDSDPGGYERAVPLPGEVRDGSAEATQSAGEPVIPFDEDAVLGPRYDKSLYPVYFERPPQTLPPSKEGGENTASAVDISGPLPITTDGYTCDNTYDLDAPCGPYDGAPEVVYRYTASASVSGALVFVNISLCNPSTNYDTRLWVLKSDGFTPVACNDDGCDMYRSELLGVALMDGESYYIVVGGYDAKPTSCGEYVLTVTEASDPLVCQPGDADEGELCGTQANDGPSMATPTWGNIADGETICGTLYADGGIRDNDYFHFVVTAPNGEDVTFACASDATMGYFIMLMNANATGFYTYEIGDGLSNISIGPMYLDPGTYTIRVTMNLSCGSGDCTGYGCGSNPTDPIDGNYRYRLSLDSYVPQAGDDCSLAQALSVGVNSFDMSDYTPDNAGMLAYYGFGVYNGWFVYHVPYAGWVHFAICPDQQFQGGSTSTADRFGMAVWPGCYESTSSPDLSTLLASTGINGNLESGPWVDYRCSTDGDVELVIPSFGGDLYLEVFALTTALAGRISGTLTVWVNEMEPPTGDACSLAGNLGSGEVHDFFVHNYSARTDGAYSPNYGTSRTSTRCDDQGLNGNGLGADVWYRWTANQTGWWTVNTCKGPGWDGKLEIFEGFDCLYANSRLPIVCGDDDCGREGQGTMPSVEFHADAGDQFLLRLGGWFSPPDYPTASQGSAYINISYSPGPAPRPTNDACTGADVAVLYPGTPVSRTGTLDNASNHDCLYSPPAVWEACNLPDLCGNVSFDYCGTYGVEGTNDENYWVADEVLYTDCPCLDGSMILASNKLWNLCPQQYYLKTLVFNDLTPGTYYFPITPGFRACPRVGYYGCDYGVTFSVDELTCAYCDASGDVSQCHTINATWIQRVRFNTIDNGYHSSSPMPDYCTGYSDFTSVTTNVFEGVAYELRVTGAKNGPALDDNDVLVAYIDWDQDYSFLKPGDAFPLTLSGSDYAGTIVIPTDLPAPGEGPSGVTVMRLRLSRASETTNAPCGDITWGEVEDYALAVAPLPCGDFDLSGVVDAADIQAMKGLYFDETSAAPMLWQMADATGDCAFNIADIIYLADYVYGRVLALQCDLCPIP